MHNPSYLLIETSMFSVCDSESRVTEITKGVVELTSSP